MNDLGRVQISNGSENKHPLYLELLGNIYLGRPILLSCKSILLYLLRFEPPVTYSDKISPVCLLELGDEAKVRAEPATYCYATGILTNLIF